MSMRLFATAVVGVAGLAVVFGVGWLLADRPDDGNGGDSNAARVRAAEIQGSALPQFDGTADRDPAVGQTAPGAVGRNFAGERVRLGAAADSAQAIAFLAHWCPHCQREVPQLVQWAGQGVVPDDVQLVAVSTLQDRNRPNWPPDEWLAREDWPGKVLADPNEEVARAYGLSGTPFWVFVDDDGTVTQRASGRLSQQRLEAALATIQS